MRLAFSQFAFHARRAAVFTLCSVSFALIALSAGESDTHGDSVTARVKSAVVSTVNNNVPSTGSKMKPEMAVKARPVQQSELYRQLQSGFRSSEEISEEYTNLTGDGPGLEFNSGTVDRAYKLSMILTRVSSHLQNPLDVLFIHTLPSYERPEDEVTFFSRKIDGMDERNYGFGLNLSRIIEMNDKGEPIFSEASRFFYRFDLKSNRVERDFDLREPKGIHEIGPSRPDEFDPLRLLTQKELPFDLGLYGYEIVREGRTFLIHLTVRHTEVETLTVEISMQELGSAIRRNIVLVYEEL